MNRQYIYSSYNKDFLVFPLTQKDNLIINRLNVEVENYFQTFESGKFKYRIYVVSGSNEKTIDFEDENIDIIKKINCVWREMNINPKENIHNWNQILNDYIEILDYKSGLFRIKNLSKCYIILTDFESSYGQMYKVHCAFEFLLVYLSTFENAVLFHSSCAGFNLNNCHLFIGKSGVGKSTIAKNIENNGGYVIDDERNIVILEDNKYMVYSGQTKAIKRKFDYKYVERGELKGIYFLHHSKNNLKEQITYSEQMFSNVKAANIEVGGFRDNLPILNKLMIDSFIKKLLNSVPTYNLYFTIDCDLKIII